MWQGRNKFRSVLPGSIVTGTCLAYFSLDTSGGPWESSYLSLADFFPFGFRRHIEEMVPRLSLLVKDISLKDLI